MEFAGMGKGRKPRVDWDGVYELVDEAHQNPLSDSSHGKLRATVKLLEEYLADAKSSEKSDKLLNPKDSKKKDDQQKERKGGKGRNGADDHLAAEVKPIPHESLKPGDCCPDCARGRIYECKNKPAKDLRFEAQPLIKATVYKRQRLKCNHCDATFTAAPPEGVGEEKYDESVSAALAVSRFGAGLPALRIEGLLKQFGILLPDSTQWELVRDAADLAQPMMNALVRFGANCRNLYTDDTSMFMIEQKRHLPGRTGLFTTAIVCEGVEGRAALYFTGEQHAGENLADLLRHRAEGAGAPLVMFDALSRNHPKAQKERIELVVSNCLTHGRRNFVYALNNFPEECNYLLSELGQVYHNEARAKELGLDPDARLLYHQTHSQPVLSEIHGWATRLYDNSTEPNSPLGKAITYLLKHWKGLTEFLRTPGAAVDNNICERAIKKMVLYRKNSLFYRNENGSSVGDVFMSLIHTCELNEVPAFTYLVAVLKHADEVQANPEAWLPWEFKARLDNKSPPPELLPLG